MLSWSFSQPKALQEMLAVCKPESEREHDLETADNMTQCEQVPVQEGQSQTDHVQVCLIEVFTYECAPLFQEENEEEEKEETKKEKEEWREGGGGGYNTILNNPEQDQQGCEKYRNIQFWILKSQSKLTDIY